MYSQGMPCDNNLIFLCGCDTPFIYSSSNVNVTDKHEKWVVNKMSTVDPLCLDYTKWFCLLRLWVLIVKDVGAIEVLQL